MPAPATAATPTLRRASHTTTRLRSERPHPVSRSGDKLTMAFELGKDQARGWRSTRKAPPLSTTDKHSQAIYGTGH